MPQEKPSPYTRAQDSKPSTKPVPVRQSENSMPSVPEALSLSHNRTLRTFQGLARVELGEGNQPSPGAPPLSITPASQPLQGNARHTPPPNTTSASPPHAELVTTSAGPDQQATTPPAPPRPTQQFVYKYVRAGAMLGIGGSGGWMPPSYVRVRVPVETTGGVVPAHPGQPRTSPSPQGASDKPRSRDQSSAQVALQQPSTDAQRTSKAEGESTVRANGETRR